MSKQVRYPSLAGWKQEGRNGALEFHLEGLLPAMQVLTFNVTLGTLALLGLKDNQPCMLEEQQFTTGELCVLIPLLQSYPYHCPYEVLLASFEGGRFEVNEEIVSRYRNRLYKASGSGGRLWDQEMKPVRNALSRTRFKFRHFGIQISSVIEIGYILGPGERIIRQPLEHASPAPTAR